INYQVQMHNTGRSSVKVLSLQYDVLKTPKPKDVYKGATFEEISIGAGESSNPAPLIKAGAHVEKYPYLGGYVTYRCKFGQLHRTHFCYEVTKVEQPEDAVYVVHFTRWTRECNRERDWPADT